MEGVEVSTDVLEDTATDVGAGGSGVAVTTSVDAGGYSVMVVGDADVTIKTIVEGVSDSVITTVDSCVAITVCVLVTASVTVVAGASLPPVLPPSTATTEYEAGLLRSIESGIKGRALARSSNEESDMEARMGLEAILMGFTRVSSEQNDSE